MIPWLAAVALAADPKDDAITLTPFTGVEVFVGDGTNRLVAAGSVLPSEGVPGLRFDVGISTPLDPDTRMTTFSQGQSGTLGGFQGELFLGYDRRGYHLATLDDATAKALVQACGMLGTPGCTPEKLEALLVELEEAPVDAPPCVRAGLPEGCTTDEVRGRVAAVRAVLAATVDDPDVLWALGADLAVTYDRVEAYPYIDLAAPIAAPPPGSVLDPDAEPVGWDDVDIQGGGHLALVVSQAVAVDLRGGAGWSRDIVVDTAPYCPTRDAGDARGQEGCGERTWLSAAPEGRVEGYVRAGLTGVIPKAFGASDAVPGGEARFNVEGLGPDAAPVFSFRAAAFLMPVRKIMQVSVGAGVQVDVALSDRGGFEPGEVQRAVPFGFVGGTLGRSDPLAGAGR